MNFKKSILMIFMILSINALSNSYMDKPKEKVKADVDKMYNKFKSKDLVDKAIEKKQEQEQKKEYDTKGKTAPKIDYSDLNNKVYTKTKAQVQGNNKYANNIYNPQNTNVYTQDNVRYIMIDVADRKTKGGHKRTEIRNDDYRGVMTIEGNKVLNPYSYTDEFRPNGSSLGGGHIIYNMWARDKTPTVKIAKLSGVAGDDKAFVKALEDIFDGYKKPRTAKTQQAILETMENITYVQIAKVQIAQENMKLLEQKYKNAESMDAFYQDKENQAIFQQMAKYHEDLAKSVLTTAKMEEVYGTIGQVNTERGKFQEINKERLAFLANMAEFTQKLQNQNSIGDVNEAKKIGKSKSIDYSKLSYKDLDNISFDKIYALIQKGDKKSIADNMEILDSLLKQNNQLFNYTLTTLQAFKRNNSYNIIREEKLAVDKEKKENFHTLALNQSFRSLGVPTEKEKANIKKADTKDPRNSKKDLIEHNSKVAFETYILGK